jgi:spermidine synthase
MTPRDAASTNWPDRVRFLRRFVANPRRVGSVVPSSHVLATAMVSAIRHSAGVSRGRTIVELGTGTGAFTRAIVAELQPADEFMSVEVEPAFIDALCRQWPEVDFVCASAESLYALIRERDLGQVDHIVSGLPFATLPAETTRRIVAAVAASMRPGGTFTTFHYVHSFGVPPAVSFRRLMRRALGSVPSIDFVGWNFPPALALTWTNRQTSTGKVQP